MLLTIEVRWFGRGEVPPAVVRWFAGCPGQAAAYPPRTDHYLWGTGEALGVKLREGRLEVKPRLTVEGVVPFHPHMAGQVERWAKWSFPLAEGYDALASVRTSAAWIAVGKARALRAYAIGADGALAPAPPGQVPPQGCTLEFTHLQVRGQAWWTVGFESYGEGPGLRARLYAVVERVLAAGTPPQLDAATSCGYAAWLEDK